jgi:hypothetical protein
MIGRAERGGVPTFKGAVNVDLSDLVSVYEALVCGAVRAFAGPEPVPSESSAFLRRTTSRLQVGRGRRWIGRWQPVRQVTPSLRVRRVGHRALAFFAPPPRPGRAVLRARTRRLRAWGLSHAPEAASCPRRHALDLPDSELPAKPGSQALTRTQRSHGFSVCLRSCMRRRAACMRACQCRCLRAGGPGSGTGASLRRPSAGPSVGASEPRREQAGAGGTPGHRTLT